MKISTSIGMHSGRALPLNYQYTWAFDASKQTSLTDPEITGASTYNATLVDDGININYSASSTTGMAFQEADFTAGSISGGSGTEVIPDGSVSQTVGGAVGHPGRYFSTVVTIHDLTVADGTLGEPFGILINIGSGSLINATTLGSDPSHINGNFRLGAPGVVYNPGTDGGIGDPNGDLAMTQAEINSILERPIAVTYDLAVGFYNSVLSDDPSIISIFPAHGENVTMNATIHGFILSNVPPVINYLPLEIKFPSL